VILIRLAGGLALVPDHPPEPFDPGNEDGDESLFADFAENRDDRVLQLPPIRTIEARQSFLEKVEEEEASRRKSGL
jgi:hypothetical protein